MLLKRLYDQLAKKAVINYSKFVIKTDYDAKIKDIDDKIPRITNLATTAALISFENKIPNVSNLFKKKKKKDYDAEISQIEQKYFTTSDYEFTNDILDAKIKKLVNKI